MHKTVVCSVCMHIQTQTYIRVYIRLLNICNILLHRVDYSHSVEAKISGTKLNNITKDEIILFCMYGGDVWHQQQQQQQLSTPSSSITNNNKYNNKQPTRHTHTHIEQSIIVKRPTTTQNSLGMLTLPVYRPPLIGNDHRGYRYTCIHKHGSMRLQQYCMNKKTDAFSHFSAGCFHHNFIEK